MFSMTDQSEQVDHRDSRHMEVETQHSFPFPLIITLRKAHMCSISSLPNAVLVTVAELVWLNMGCPWPWRVDPRFTTSFQCFLTPLLFPSVSQWCHALTCPVLQTVIVSCSDLSCPVLQTVVSCSDLSCPLDSHCIMLWPVLFCPSDSQ